MALVFGLARLGWDVAQPLIMVLPFLYWPFAYRQTIFGALALAVLGFRLAGLLKARGCALLGAALAGVAQGAAPPTHLA